MLSLLALLLAVAAPRAQDNAPGGFRSSPELPCNSAALRPATVIDPEWANVLQLGFDGRVYREPWSLHLQAPVIHAWRPDGTWSATGLGAARISAARAVSKKPRWVGLELYVPLAPPGFSSRSWATISQESTFGAGARLFYERSWDLRSPISLRAAAGAHYWGSCPYCGPYTRPGTIPAGEIIASRSWMISPGWAVVSEGELTIDHVPASIRAMGRRVQPIEDGALVVDLGLQIPPLSWADYPSAQFIAQIRWYPQGITVARPEPPPEEDSIEWDELDPLLMQE